MELYDKNCGKKKARCVADCSPKQTGSVKLAHTYAACLEQPGAHIFWGTTALKTLLTYGCDCSNAFVEAPAPKAPLYLRIDKQFREWWENHKNRQPLSPAPQYVKVNHAIQGHPESPRLWQEFINDILIKKLKFKAAIHESCLYKKTFANRRRSTNTSPSRQYCSCYKDKRNCSTNYKRYWIIHESPY